MRHLVTHQGEAMYTLQLPDGRDILLERIEIRGTYEGHSEGSYKSVSEYVLEKLATQSLQNALQVIANTSPLPKYRFDARFSSAAFAPENSDLRSTLTVVWFADQVQDTFSELFRRMIPAIQWQRFATEYDPYDF